VSRDDGFPRADVSVALYDDDKVKRLYRELGGDLGRMGHAMMLCEATLLASWRDGKRRTVHEAAPLWLTVDDGLVAVLVKVGLLDRSHRRPLRSWNNWFGPAWESREKRRRSGALGGRPPKNLPADDQKPTLKPSLNHSDNNRKPLPTHLPTYLPASTARPRARRGDDKTSPTTTNNGRLLEALDPETARKLGLGQPMAPVVKPPADAPAESRPGGTT
jgi:hypothetical protein